MLGCEIIEAAADGDLLYWSAKRAARVVAEHECGWQAFLADCGDEAARIVTHGTVRADIVLAWLGY